MEEQNVKCIWVGPSGVNPILGSVVHGEDKDLSKSDFEYFLSRGLVQLPKRDEKEADLPKEKEPVKAGSKKK